MIFITALAIFKNTVYVCPANPLQRQTALIRTGSIIYSVIPLYNYCFSNSCLTAHNLFIRYRSTSIHYPLQGTLDSNLMEAASFYEVLKEP
jgi:hypothetical protein